ncbi:PQQ-binding-like beta-propeller repeat protein [Verrucomicrobia bacterium]|nr:PQQ-binding-like beta-propeller repeat protein [Verrucomicrobiota bacterium]
MSSYQQDSRDLMTETEFQIHCVGLTDGALQWSHTLINKTPAFTIHPSNTYATGSPATDGKALFVHFAAAGGIAALDFDGKERWKLEVGAFKAGNGFGAGSSLTIGESLLFLQCDNDRQSFVVAIKPETGNVEWKIDRDSRTSWSSPIIWKNRTRTELILCGADTVTSYEPDTGLEIWKLSGFGGSFSASPAFDSNQIYFGNSGPGSAGPLTTIAAGAEGDVPYQKGQASTYSAWARTGSGPGLSSPVADEGFLYISAGTGILSCYDTETGTRLYKERLPNAGSIAASLWIANNELYALDELGTTHVIETGPEFKVNRRNTIDDLFWSTPAVLSDTLLLRGADHLYCIRRPDIR